MDKSQSSPERRSRLILLSQYGIAIPAKVTGDADVMKAARNRGLPSPSPLMAAGRGQVGNSGQPRTSVKTTRDLLVHSYRTAELRRCGRWSPLLALPAELGRDRALEQDRTDNRPALTEALTTVESGAATALVVAKLDRLSPTVGLRLLHLSESVGLRLPIRANLATFSGSCNSYHRILST